MNRLFLINKESGVTSFQTVARVRRKLNIKKAGHAGTLDQFASGLLLILTGRYTRLVEYFTDFDKVYRAVFEFGKETDTLDPEGNIVSEGMVPSRSAIETALPSFFGKIQQQPPCYSAVHIGGQRAYRLARRGDSVDMPFRNVNIFDWKILDYSPPFLETEIHCSKGTYVRSLARDLGRACGSCAYVSKLQRFSVGGFRLEEAVTVDELNPDGSNGLSDRALFDKVCGISVCALKPEFLSDFTSGKVLHRSCFTDDLPENGFFAVFCRDRFAGMMESAASGQLRYRFVAAESQ